MMPAFFEKAFEVAAQIHDPVTVCVCGAVLACVAYWRALPKNDQNNTNAEKTKLWPRLLLSFGIVFLSALPLIARTYQSTYGIYEIRVVVLGLDGMPIDDSLIICSPGGEQKRINGGWECDVAPRSRPADGRFVAYATQRSAHLTGNKELQLSDDFTPGLIIQLRKDSSAVVRGEVLGTGSRSLAGARVSVVGLESESAVTHEDGGFFLASHAANGEMITLHVEAKGYKVYEGLQQAGDTAISIRLSR